MDKKFLQVGDVFMVSKGFMAYADMPERFAYANTSFSMKMAEDTEVKVGEVRKPVSPNDELRSIAVDFKESLDAFGLHIAQEEIKAFLDKAVSKVKLPDKLDTSAMIGEYVVTAAASDGGGSGMGYGDSYPDGWHVTAKQLTKDGLYSLKGTVINFYQSGCFTIMHKEKITVLRKMQMTFQK
jgi:hypothetical protein